MSEGAKRFLHIWAIGSGQFKAGWWVDTDTEVTSSGSEEKAETVGQTQFHQPRISSHTPLSLTPLQGWQYCLASAQSGGGLLCECISVHNQREGCLVNASVCTIRGRVAWWVHECAQSGGGCAQSGGGEGVLGECLSVLSPELDIEFHFQVSPTPLPPFRLSFRKILNKLCRQTLNQCWPWICYLSISVSWVIGVSALCYTYTRGPFYSSLRENSFTFCTGLIEYQDVTFGGRRLWN